MRGAFGKDRSRAGTVTRVRVIHVSEKELALREQHYERHFT